MPFELTILGSSSATPTQNRHPTAQVLNIRERFFLIDCGEGTQSQLVRYKIKYSRIGHIFISHLHDKRAAQVNDISVSNIRKL